MLKNPYYVYGPKTLEIPAHINFGDFILENMWKYRNNVAAINAVTDERVTYGEIVQQSINFSLSLSRIGVRKGETIGVLSENRQEFWGAAIGVVCAGAVLTTISTGYVKAELLHTLNISKPSHIVCSPTMFKKHYEILKSVPFLKKIILFGTEIHPDVIMYNDLAFQGNNMIKNVRYDDFEAVRVDGQNDTVFVLYSSGTTGLPKGVMLTHLNVISACSLPPSHDPREITLTISPWYHTMGLIGWLMAMAVGRTGVYIPKFEIDLYMKTIEKYKVVQLIVVPPVLVAARKYECNYDLSTIKLVYSGAAPLHKDTTAAVRKKFPNLTGVYQGYGATEVTLAILRHCFQDFVTDKVGSVGMVVASTVIKVVDQETRKPVGPNTRGEICAKGQMIMKGYIGKDQSEDFDDEGFYKTGDIGYYDEDKYFYIVDRLKELIKYKGYQVPPAELEAVLLQHPGIKEAAVIGIPDTEAGEVPLAFVVPQPGEVLEEKEVQEFIANRLSNPKHLRGGVRFIKQIPKSASGKLLRKELRNMLKTVKSNL